MAFVFTLLSMLMTCGADLFEKKSVSSKTEEALKTVVWYGIFNVILFIVIILFGMDETSLMPHELICKTPVVLLTPLLNSLCLFFGLMAYKHVGVSIKNTFGNTDGLFFVLLLVFFHITTGNAHYAVRLFTPFAVSGLILIITAGIVYPNIKARHNNDSDDQSAPPEANSKERLITGILLALTAAFFDGAESMVTSVLIGDDIVDSADFLAASSLMHVIIALFIWIYLWLTDKKPYNPFGKTEKNRFISQLFLLGSDILYIFAVFNDPLLGIILWNAFPILDIIGARIFMKEKLSFRQYMILIILIVGAVLVSLS
ncbi:hypothetical protein QYZ88_010380 [Lachnospiraceae bacterium C1.1]|nr:hypothetical protein [Lachnospiraceae bacterium C1.1]